MIQAVPLYPWVVRAGRVAIKYGVHVAAADDFGLTLSASNGSLDGSYLRRYWLHIPGEALDCDGGDYVADFAASEIRRAVNAGYVMRETRSLEPADSESAARQTSV